MTKDEKTGIWYREGTFDSWILNESRNYFPVGIRSDDRILDLGGHIGTFASRAMLEMKVPLVSIEAEQSNYEVLRLNSDLFEFNAWPNAIVSQELHGKPITVYVNEKKNNALHSTVPVRGRSEQQVVGFGFTSALLHVRPTIIKVDIEGAEYGLEWDILIAHPEVRLVIFELHLTSKGHREKAAQLHEVFQNIGFSVQKAPRIGEKNWTTMATYIR